MTNHPDPLDGATAHAARAGLRNDAFRRSIVRGRGRLALPGTVRLDPGITHRCLRFRDAVLRAVARDDRFPIERDPFGDRFQGRVAVDGIPLDWRIDTLPRGGVEDHRILSVRVA